jgi:hypothetical protein
MKKKGLAALRRVMGAGEPSHLTDSMLSALVTDEAAGINLEQRYPAEMAHLNECAPCLQKYDELYQVAAGILEQMAAETAALMAAVPATTAMAAVPATTAVSAGYGERLRQLLDPNEIWGRAIEAVARWEEQWHVLQLALAPPKGMALLHGEGQVEGENWLLTYQEVGERLPLNVKVTATRLTSTTCRLTIQVDRLGLRKVAGRRVTIDDGGRVATAETNNNGIVTFEPVAITALAHLTIRVAP